MKAEEPRQGLPDTDTNRAPSVAMGAAVLSRSQETEWTRGAFLRMCAHLRRRNGRVSFDRRGVEA